MGRVRMRACPRVVWLAAPFAAFGFATFARGAITAWNLVSALDPNNNGTVMNISDATSNSGTDGLTLASFTPLVSSAYTNNLGGVFSFEAGSGGTGTNTQLTTVGANSTTGDSATNDVRGYDGAIYTPGSGAPSAAPIVGFYRSDASASGSAAFDWNSNQGQILASGNSGGGYLGIQGSASYSITIQPLAGYGVTDFGLTDIARDTSGQTSGPGNFTVHFSDGSSIASSTATLTSTTPPPGTGVFFGFQAPSGLTITSVDWANSGSASRFDDLALIVAPVPEPASIGILSIAGFGLLRRRRA
jgi:hypothetical protein